MPIQSDSKKLRLRTHKANQAMHGKLASIYNEMEPHYRPENRQKVRRRLEQLATKCNGKQRMLDLGCGTGFMLELAQGLFAEMDGIDITPEMLSRVDTSFGQIHLHLASAEELPFKDNTFDLITAYSFLDHVADPSEVLQEAFRVLAPGGYIYVDLIPNREFWQSLTRIASVDQSITDPIVVREINEVVHHEDRMFEKFGILPNDWRDAEPLKALDQGFLSGELLEHCEKLHFTEVSIHHEWYLGQAFSIHERSPDVADHINEHLQKLLPLSSHLFKYLLLIGRKQ